MKNQFLPAWLSYTLLLVLNGAGLLYAQELPNLLNPVSGANSRFNAASSASKLAAIKRSQPATINFSGASKRIPEKFNLNLFDDLNLPVQRVAEEENTDGTQTWYGRTADPAFDHLPNYRNVVITNNPAKQSMIATLFYRGKEYQIKPLSVSETVSGRLATSGESPVHWVVEKGETGSAFCQEVPLPGSKIKMNTVPKSIPGARLAAGEADCNNRYYIDVFIGFSTLAAADVGDHTAMANQMIAEVNNGLANSLVSNVRLRLVGIGLTPNNPGIVGSVLQDGQGWFATEMAATGADYLAIVQKSTGAAGEVGGIAYLPGNVSVNGSYDPTAVFRHEIGHSAGGNHCPSDGGGIVLYAGGYTTGNWSTHLCGNSVNFYSTPAVSDNLGQPIGDAATADMARVWTERAEAMASVRTHVVPYECTNSNCPAWGPYITGRGLGYKPGLVLMSEVMAPNECIAFDTYWRSLDFSLGLYGGSGGIQGKTGNGVVYTNSLSIRDVQAPSPSQFIAEYQISGEIVSGGQGTLTTEHAMPWTPGIWYTTVVRRWYTGGTQTRIGFFMYDYGTGRWTHYVTVLVPQNDAYFGSDAIGGGLEKLAGAPEERCGYWRNFWKLNSDGSWNKSTQIETIAATGAWKAEQTNAAEVKLSSCGPYTNPQTTNQFTLTIPEAQPNVVTPAFINRLTPIYQNGQLTVNWQIDDRKAPQLSYDIKIYDNPALSGEPVAQVSGIRPEQRSDFLSVSALPKGTYYVRLQVKDIFEQESNVMSAYFATDKECSCSN